MSSGRYQNDCEPFCSVDSIADPPKKSPNRRSIAVCRLASSPTGVQRLIAILHTSFRLPAKGWKLPSGLEITREAEALNRAGIAGCRPRSRPSSGGGLPALLELFEQLLQPLHRLVRAGF